MRVVEFLQVSVVFEWGWKGHAILMMADSANLGKPMCFD